jgi:purine-binding chemotaxis protein CheW
MGCQFATFVLDGLYFGVDVRAVQEVLRYQPSTPVPLAPAVIHGLINLRGQIVTAIDLRRRVGLTPRGADAQPMNVVVRTDDGPVSLLVDEIGDVVDVNDEQFEPVPETVRGQAADVVAGVYKLQPRLLLVLDVERAVMVGDERAVTARNALVA